MTSEVTGRRGRMHDGRLQFRTLGRLDLSGPDGTPAHAVLAQPKRLALLLYLAAAVPRGYHRKDTLLALFWPESPDGRARRALNRAVFWIRHTLDREVLLTRGDEELAVAAERLWCDVVAFDGALAAGRREEALALYHGDFAPGLFVDGAAEFEHWMGSERSRLRDQAQQSALGLAAGEEARGELRLAEHWAHRATVLAPHDERAAQLRMRLLDQAGDRAGALATYDSLAARLRDDLGVEPSPETLAIAAAIRSRRIAVGYAAASIPAPGAVAPPPAALPAGPAPRATRSLFPVRRLLRTPWMLGAGLVLGGALSLALYQTPPTATGLGRRVAVAVAPEVESWPALSPDGGTVFYTVSVPGGEELYAQQVEGGSPVPLTRQIPGSQRYGTPSPDGAQLLFLGEDGLYVMPALGGQPRRVVPAGASWTNASGDGLADRIDIRQGLLWGCWAPDGASIAYTDGDTLYVQAIEASGRTALASGQQLHSPAWSSDGRWIAFVEGNAGFHVRGNFLPSAVRLVRSTGGSAIAITDATALNTSPVWVPGRRALLFISDREGGRDIYEITLNEDGSPRGKPVRVTTGLDPERISISRDGRRLAWSLYTKVTNLWALDIPGHDSVPISRARQLTTETQNIEAAASISPDGAWLYYNADRSGNADLWRLPLAGGPPERLTTDPGGDFYPAVSPDGREVAFHSSRSGDRDIYVMPVAGGSPVQVSTSPLDDAVPAWSPDGQALIWRVQDTVRIARRNGDGSWGTVEPLKPVPGGGVVQWSPDGRWISLASARGFELLDPVGRELHPLRAARGFFWHTWSADSRTIYGALTDPGGRMVILAVPIAGGKPRLLAYADHPLTQVYDRGLVVSGSRFYFPLVERKADVWLGVVEER